MENRKYILNGKNITLMPLKDKDYFDMIEMVLDPLVNGSYMLKDLNSVGEKQQFFNRLMEMSKNINLFVYGIYFEDNLIGFLNEVDKNEISIEVGYFISPKFWNRGFATEALKLAIEELFHMGYLTVFASHFESNKASGRVMEKAGMHPYEKDEEIEYRGILQKCICYRIDK